MCRFLICIFLISTFLVMSIDETQAWANQKAVLLEVQKNNRLNHQFYERGTYQNGQNRRNNFSKKSRKKGFSFSFGSNGFSLGNGNPNNYNNNEDCSDIFVVLDINGLTYRCKYIPFGSLSKFPFWDLKIGETYTADFDPFDDDKLRLWGKSAGNIDLRIISVSGRNNRRNS